MKFESKFGLGEICIYNDTSDQEGRRGQLKDELVKVVAISFQLSGETTYTCEYVNNVGFHRFSAFESTLSGDPDFDQETGYSETGEPALSTGQ